MLNKNFLYKGIDFSTTAQQLSQATNWYSYILKNYSMTPWLRTDYFDMANYHGSFTSETLSSWRTLTFDFELFGDDCEKRAIWWNALLSAIQPEQNPWSLTRWFYKLNMYDCDAWDKFVYAKVVTLPDPTLPDICKKNFTFTFSLYSESEKVFWDTYNTSTWTIGFQGWMTLATTLPTTLSGYVWYITCTNDWNWAAPINLSLIWDVTNPKIINITNGNKYRITKSTTNLIYNNINLENDPTKRLLVTDAGVNISAYRDSGAGIYLEPWDNDLVILADSYTWTPTAAISRYDTYLF